MSAKRQVWNSPEYCLVSTRDLRRNENSTPVRRQDMQDILRMTEKNRCAVYLGISLYEGRTIGSCMVRSRRGWVCRSCRECHSRRILNLLRSFVFHTTLFIKKYCTLRIKMSIELFEELDGFDDRGPSKKRRHSNAPASPDNYIISSNITPDLHPGQYEQDYFVDQVIWSDTGQSVKQTSFECCYGMVRSSFIHPG